MKQLRLMLPPGMTPLKVAHVERELKNYNRVTGGTLLVNVVGNTTIRLDVPTDISDEAILNLGVIAGHAIAASATLNARP